MLDKKLLKRLHFAFRKIVFKVYNSYVSLTFYFFVCSNIFKRAGLYLHFILWSSRFLVSHDYHIYHIYHIYLYFYPFLFLYLFYLLYLSIYKVVISCLSVCVK